MFWRIDPEESDAIQLCRRLHNCSHMWSYPSVAWEKKGNTMSEQGCPIRGPKGLCQWEHNRLVNPKWDRPHHDETAATPCPGEDCERRVREQRDPTLHFNVWIPCRRYLADRRKPRTSL